MVSEKSRYGQTSEIFTHENREIIPNEDTSRSALVLRIILFQFKLFADGIRDIVLSPLSIAAGILGLLFSSSDPHAYFNRLLKLGHRSDRWINLFDNYSSRSSSTNHTTMDDLAEKLESTLRKDYQSNGMTAKTVRKFDEIIAEMKRRHH